jgi:hypothetical protein
VDFIKQRKTDKLALSIFADFAYIAVPLTYDKNFFSWQKNKQANTAIMSANT